MYVNYLGSDPGMSKGIQITNSNFIQWITIGLVRIKLLETNA